MFDKAQNFTWMDIGASDLREISWNLSYTHPIHYWLAVLVDWLDTDDNVAVSFFFLF
ncbi:MAG: hypothetical protein OXJ52_06450 [Oligoflexia bacterium]|nr:hypothetical protein [Oligoflexia bacterium]